ncbi:MAG: sulfite exporter TauE/SafE family protein [Treponema sp.]|jgi:sulfite exporter TauE/SafE/copper chaperone CopZ/plastocyanin domain-containing protein|nr:sulfite exporter TauE/SafE family protein [Treponema sp.]
MKTKTIRIGGMTCISCQNRIEKKLKCTVGVEDATVNFNTGTATVTYNTSVITLHEIAQTIEKMDYQVLDNASGSPAQPPTQIIGTLVIILALYMILRQFGTSSFTSAFPLAETGMGYGMLFIIGLITSVHCVAMCGGINLSQCIPQLEIAPKSGDRSTVLLPSMLYNAGRVISYTVVGVIVGALGSVITVSGRFQGIVQLAAGVFMIMMGINMLGVFPWLRRFNLHLPKIFAKKIDEQKSTNKNPLFIGLLNGLMPCGPLQAMQLYALSTGSPIAGGISMFLFSLGTVPLMFGIGALSSVLSKKFTARVMKVGAMLVTVLGLTMFSNGWSLGGFPSPIDKITGFINPFGSAVAKTESAVFEPLVENGVQIVNSTLNAGRYPAITVQQGIPVKWTINAPAGSINGCNNRMIIREYGIEYRFKNGENVIEFTPGEIGRFSYSCWMGMIRSSITVVAEGETAVDVGEPDINPSPAGVSIPTDAIAIAKMNGDDWQTVTINLRDEGFDPAILVVQKNIPVEWIINNDSLDEGNSSLIVPAYYAKVEIDQGDNVIQFMPSEDFDFSTMDNIFYGYVEVVDDINTVDIEAIKAEVSEFETLMYPDAYFDALSQGACCR